MHGRTYDCPTGYTAAKRSLCHSFSCHKKRERRAQKILSPYMPLVRRFTPTVWLQAGILQSDGKTLSRNRVIQRLFEAVSFSVSTTIMLYSARRFNFLDHELAAFPEKSLTVFGAHFEDVRWGVVHLEVSFENDNIADVAEVFLTGYARMRSLKLCASSSVSWWWGTFGLHSKECPALKKAVAPSKACFVAFFLPY